MVHETDVEPGAFAGAELAHEAAAAAKPGGTAINSIAPGNKVSVTLFPGAFSYLAEIG